MIRSVGSASRLAKYPPPTVNPAKALGILVKLDHSFLCRLRLKYLGHVRGSGLTGSEGEIRSEDPVVEVDEAAVARVREEEARYCLWPETNGRTADEIPVRDILGIVTDSSTQIDSVLQVR